MRYSFLVNLMQKLSKSVNFCKSYCKKFTATFLCPQCSGATWQIGINQTRHQLEFKKLQ